jgi:uncharacterized protein (DUF2236 family)
MFAAGPISLPQILLRPLNVAACNFLHVDGDPDTSFLKPKGSAALMLHDSISWRVFKNPLVLFVGGIAAVLLELAEPRVRTGVWEHSNFRAQPLVRMRRTGLAALTTVYAARCVSEAMIARIVRLHETIKGQTPSGRLYSANDPELLTWVHATAAFSFFHAYSRYVQAQSHGHFDSFCREGQSAAALYGAVQAPVSEFEMEALFTSAQDHLEPSPIVLEFLEIMRTTPILPLVLRPLQRVLVRAAIDILPQWVRQRLALGNKWDMGLGEVALVNQIGKLADRVLIRSNPAVQACVRLGLPEDYLYQPAVMVPGREDRRARRSLSRKA